MYLPGYSFVKAKVMLIDIQSESVQQKELDLEPLATTDNEPTPRHNSKLMAAMDVIHGRYNRETLYAAATGQSGPAREWGMKQERRTPRYTTRLEDVPVVRA
jgi:DNA polymerase V